MLDSNVFVSAIRSRDGASRAVVRLCLTRQVQPLMGEKLYNELEDVLRRRELFQRSALDASERDELADALFSVSEWVDVFFLWRPNLRDEGDNYLIELAVAGNATSIVTHNVRDFRSAELRFPEIIVETPAAYVRRRRSDLWQR